MYVCMYVCLFVSTQISNTLGVGTFGKAARELNTIDHSSIVLSTPLATWDLFLFWTHTHRPNPLYTELERIAVCVWSRWQSTGEDGWAHVDWPEGVTGCLDLANLSAFTVYAFLCRWRSKSLTRERWSTWTCTRRSGERSRSCSGMLRLFLRMDVIFFYFEAKLVTSKAGRR